MNGFEYLNDESKKYYFIKYYSTCINGYDTIFTLGIFEYVDTLTAIKKQFKFNNAKNINLKLKA